MEKLNKDQIKTIAEYYFVTFVAVVFIAMSSMILWGTITEHGIAKGIILGVFIIAAGIAFFYIYIIFAQVFTSLIMYGSILFFPVAFIYFIEIIITGEWSIWGFNPILVLIVSVFVSAWGYFNYRLGRIAFGEDWIFLGY